MSLNLSAWNLVAAAVLLAAAVYSAIAALRTDLPWKKWRLGSLLACRILLLLALAAWCLELQLQFQRPARRIDMVVLADRSASLSSRGRQDVEQSILRAKSILERTGSVHVVDFGNETQGATPLAEALDQARSRFTGKGDKRILLLSDGRASTADPLLSTNLLKAEAVRVYTWPMDPLASESLVANLTVPPSLWRNVPSPVEVQIYAAAPGTARLTLVVDGMKKATQEIAVPRGASTVEMTAALETEGVHRIEVRGEFPQDTLPWNNAASALVDVPFAPRVMVLSEPPAAANQLERALSAAGLQTKVLTPAELPKEFACDCIVLNNIPAASLGDARLKAIEKFVREGGGVVFAGGQKSYGAGGYLATALEPVFPVMLTPDKEQPPYALVVVLDNSWSMNEGVTGSIGKINLAKEIAIAAMEGLNRGDWLALVSFDSDYHNIINPTRVSNLVPEKYETSRINAFGMTNILGGLSEAARLLQKIDAGYKHVVLISDGHETETGTDYSRILAAMTQQHVTVSTIGVGMGPDEKLLNTLAYAGKGRYYAARNLQEIPAVMLQEAKGMGDPLVVSAPLPIHKVQDDPALAGIDVEKLPPIDGYNRTRSRTHAWTPLTVSRKSEPLLARMRYGRGQSLAWLSSASGAWTRGWLAQKPAEYAAFWRQAVLSVLRQPFRELETTVEFRGAQPVLIAAPPAETALQISRLVGDKIETVPAGREVGTTGASAVLLTAKVPVNHAASWNRTFGKEFADPAEGIKTLQSLATATGGSFGGGDDAFAPPTAKVMTRVNPAAWLVAAIVLLVVELLLRRAPALAAVIRRKQ